MYRIAYEDVKENELTTTINAFFRNFELAKLLRRSNVYKDKGIQPVLLFHKLFELLFLHRSLFEELKRSDICAKDTFYRFLNSTSINWLNFTTTLAAKVVNCFLERLTSKERINVLIVDDTTYEKQHSRKAELLARVYDHARHKYTWGYRLLTLCWSDGNSIVPVNSALLSSNDSKQIVGPQTITDGRTCGAFRRKLAATKAPDVLLTLLDKALSAGIKARYLLCDSWFPSAALLAAVKNRKLDVIAAVKKGEKCFYLYNGEQMSLNRIFSLNKKRRGRSKYLLSVEAAIDRGSCKDRVFMPVKLVFVRNRSKKNDYLVLLSTDTTLPENEIIRLYGKRWGIEVFFKTAKSFLKLGKECHSLSYDAMTAYVAVVFARYNMLTYLNRLEEDQRSIGELFYAVCDELPDISLADAFRKLLSCFEEIFEGTFAFSKKEISQMMDKLISSLPHVIQVRLGVCL